MKQKCIYLLTLSFILLVSCTDYDEAITFDERIIGKWSLSKESTESFYEFISPSEGYIHSHDLVNSSLVSATVKLKEISFTKSMKNHGFRMVADDGKVYNKYIEIITTDSIIFSSATGNTTIYKVQ